MTTRNLTGAIAALVVLTCTASAAAEPMFLSKQYTRCASCHYSPSGGGLLTPYGRSLSGQELSTFRRVSTQPPTEGQVSGEEAFLYGLLGQALGPVQLGVSMRPSYLHYEIGAFSDSRNPLMNADVSGAWRDKGWTAYGEVGRKPAIGDEAAKAYSREHWVSWTAANGIGLKGGRFMPNFGIHVADHTSMNRSELGFDKYDQVYGIEVSRTTDRMLVQGTVSPGRAESILDDDGGQAFNATGRVQMDFGSRFVVVGSGFYRDDSDITAKSGAAGGALGFAPIRGLTIWTEGDAHIQSEGLGTSFVFVNETSWEAVRGLWLKFSPQGRTGTDVLPGVFRWSGGASWLPRTHWNVSVSFYRDIIEDTEDPVQTFLAQLHVYL
jgi:hypothetical protein